MGALDQLLEAAVHRKATDLHLAIGHPPLVRVRRDLVQLRVKAVDAGELAAVALAPLVATQRAELAAGREVVIVYEHPNGARFRGAYFPSSSGVRAVFRALSAKTPRLSELGAPDGLRELAERGGGVLIIAGPPGSGRSTTLAAMVDHAARSRGGRVLLLGSPVERVPDGDGAVMVARSVPRPALSAAVRAASREDIDLLSLDDADETLASAAMISDHRTAVFATMRAASHATAVERAPAGARVVFQTLATTPRGAVATFRGFD
jgi:twitching motility protein PilT